MKKIKIVWFGWSCTGSKIPKQKKNYTKSVISNYNKYLTS